MIVTCVTKIQKITLSSCYLTRQKIYEEKWSVSPYFLHHYEDNNEAGMDFLDKLSLKTHGAYIFIVSWLKMQFELSDYHENKHENDVFWWISAYTFFHFLRSKF